MNYGQSCGGPTDDDPASWHMRTEAWQHPDVMIGGSDAGAHLDRMSGAPYTTSWLHDCLHGKSLISLEETINHITQVPAELFGLRDRGVLKEGTFADIVIFNPETINAGEVILLNDLPGGEGRLYADVEGMHRVFVNGIPTVVDNEPTIICQALCSRVDVIRTRLQSQLTQTVDAQF